MGETALVVLMGGLWLLYFGLHSLLAANRVKQHLMRRFPGLRRFYRLMYNVIAVISVLPLVYMLYSEARSPLWQWQGAWAWFAQGLTVTAFILFGWSLRYYDGADFLGLRKAGVVETETKPALVISPFHRWVRHPWYSLGLVIVWTRNMDLLWLLSAILISFYFIIGSRWEERKLYLEYGEVYRRYQQRVPGLIPVPWKHLSRSGAAELLQQANNNSNSQ